MGAVGWRGQRLELPDDLQPEVAQLIGDCWQEDSHARPSFKQVQQPRQWGVGCVSAFLKYVYARCHVYAVLFHSMRQSFGDVRVFLRLYVQADVAACLPASSQLGSLSTGHVCGSLSTDHACDSLSAGHGCGFVVL